MVDRELSIYVTFQLAQYQLAAGEKIVGCLQHQLHTCTLTIFSLTSPLSLSVHVVYFTAITLPFF
jgi:hypothetical protein